MVELTELEIMNDENLQKAIGNDDFEAELRLNAKKLKMVSMFDAKMKKYKKTNALKNLNTGNKCNFHKRFEKICTGTWITSAAGIYKQVANNNTGEVDRVEASRMQIIPSETFRNVDTGIEKVKLEFSKHGKWNDITVDKQTISTLNKIVELSNQGIDVTSLNSKDLMQYLYDVLSLNDYTVIPYSKSISRLGWLGDDFLPYDDTIKFDGEKDFKYLFDAVTKKGSHEKWVDFVGGLRSNLYFRLLLASSFASVLIEKLNTLPFVFHMWGGTGTGKTVALMVAMSVWGNPSMGKLTRTMNMTQNSMMSTAAFLHNIPFAGDELQTIKSRYDNYDQLIMKITEGVERGRMSFSTVNETKSWLCSFLFTGEEPCTKASSGGGTKNRVIEVECTGAIVEDGNNVVNFIMENYGSAGEEFLKLIKDMDIKTMYQEIYKELISSTATTEKQAMAMAIIILADNIVSDFMFNPERLKLKDIKKFLFSSQEVDISERAFAFLNSLMARNINKFTPDAIDKWGFMPKEGEIFFNKQIISEEMAKNGYEFDAVKRKWGIAGYIEPNSQGNWTHARKNINVTTAYVKIKTDLVLPDDEKIF